MKQRYYKLLAIKEESGKQLKIKQNNLKIKQGYLEDLQKARLIIINAAQNIQDKLKARVESLVTSALQSVFARNFRFELLFEQKRNKLECTPVVIEDDLIYDDVEEDIGGGMLPIIGFALRVIFWSLQNPQSRNTLILDEPVKGSLGGELLKKTIQMYKEISSKLGIQLIIITHYPELSNIADRTFHVKHSKNGSLVETI